MIGFSCIGSTATGIRSGACAHSVGGKSLSAVKYVIFVGLSMMCSGAFLLQRDDCSTHCVEQSPRWRLISYQRDNDFDNNSVSCFNSCLATLQALFVQRQQTSLFFLIYRVAQKTGPMGHPISLQIF